MDHQLTHRAQDLEHFLRISTETTSLLAGIPITAHLRDADPAIAGGLYDGAVAVFGRCLTPGLRWGKVSKVLHLQRPHLFPTLDSRVKQTDRQPAKRRRHPQRGYQRMYWAAIRDGLVTPANVSALASVHVLLRGDADERVRQFAQLSDLRLLDLLDLAAVSQRDLWLLATALLR